MKYTIIKKEKLKRLEKNADKYISFAQQKYWFSQWKFLKPIFSWVRGDLCVSTARDEFQSLFAEVCGYNIAQIRGMEDLIAQQNKKLNYFEGIIKSAPSTKEQEEE